MKYSHNFMILFFFWLIMDWTMVDAESLSDCVFLDDIGCAKNYFDSLVVHNSRHDENFSDHDVKLLEKFISKIYNVRPEKDYRKVLYKLVPDLIEVEGQLGGKGENDTASKYKMDAIRCESLEIENKICIDHDLEKDIKQSIDLILKKNGITPHYWFGVIPEFYPMPMVDSLRRYINIVPLHTGGYEILTFPIVVGILILGPGHYSVNLMEDDGITSSIELKMEGDEVIQINKTLGLYD
jgi:hypothetical protein